MTNSSMLGIDVVVDSWGVNLEKDLKIISNWGIVIFVDAHGPSTGNMVFGTAMAKQARV